MLTGSTIGMATLLRSGVNVSQPERWDLPEFNSRLMLVGFETPDEIKHTCRCLDLLVNHGVTKFEIKKRLTIPYVTKGDWHECPRRFEVYLVTAEARAIDIAKYVQDCGESAAYLEFDAVFRAEAID